MNERLRLGPPYFEYEYVRAIYFDSAISILRQCVEAMEEIHTDFPMIWLHSKCVKASFAAKAFLEYEQNMNKEGERTNETL